MYAYLKDGVLCVSLFKENVPEGVEYVEVSAPSADWVVLDNGQIKVLTEEEYNARLLQEKKSKLIIFSKEIAKQKIEAKYPTYKQLNIIRQAKNYTQEDLQTMNDYIDTIREEQNKFEMNINQALTLEDLNQIEKELEQWQKHGGTVN